MFQSTEGQLDEIVTTSVSSSSTFSFLSALDCKITLNLTVTTFSHKTICFFKSTLSCLPVLLLLLVSQDWFWMPNPGA